MKINFDFIFRKIPIDKYCFKCFLDTSFHLTFLDFIQDLLMISIIQFLRKDFFQMEILSSFLEELTYIN